MLLGHADVTEDAGPGTTEDAGHCTEERQGPASVTNTEGSGPQMRSTQAGQLTGRHTL